MLFTVRKFLAGILEGRSPQWSAFRKKFLAGKVCQACGGTKNLEAHHVVPFHIIRELELQESNLMALCEAPGKNCHFLWGHLGLRWTTWNAHVREDVTLWQTRRRNAP